MGKRVFVDKLHAIKKGLHNFYLKNECAPVEKKVLINYVTLQTHALMAKEEILEQHRQTMAGAGQTAAMQEWNEGEGAKWATVKASEGSSLEGMVGDGTFKAGEGTEQAEFQV